MTIATPKQATYLAQPARPAAPVRQALTPHVAPGASTQSAVSAVTASRASSMASRASSVTAWASSEKIAAMQSCLGNRAIRRVLQAKYGTFMTKGSASPAVNPRGLPDRLKAGVEALSGLSLDAVRVHYNSPYPAALQALAYTQGTEIHVAPGQEQHLPHEAWHVVQQLQGRVRPTLQAPAGVSINADATLEAEADSRGARAAGGAAFHVANNSGAAPAMPSQQSVATARGAGVVQRTIHKGKTIRSKPYERLKLSGWYTALNANQQAFALALHAEDTDYTETTANAEIALRIGRGDPVPTEEQNAKAERLRRVREYVNTNAPKQTDASYIRGDILARASKRAYRRHVRKYKRLNPDRYKQTISTIEAVSPNLFSAQTAILADRVPWEQIHGLTHSKPQSYDLNIGGNEITVDSLNVRSNEARGKKRSPTALNLNQVFIEQPGGDNSYWKIADSNDPNIGKSRPHKRLRHLEVERDDRATFTTYLKDTLLESGKITTTQAFGDEGRLAYQEYKGALHPTQAMAALQTASAYQVLQIALGDANTALGTAVGVRDLTTAQKIDDALRAFLGNRTEANYKALVKEIYRLVRAHTRIDQGSDTEPDSDTDY